jgi:hypothetical protein
MCIALLSLLSQWLRVKAPQLILFVSAHQSKDDSVPISYIGTMFALYCKKAIPSGKLKIHPLSRLGRVASAGLTLGRARSWWIPGVEFSGWFICKNLVHKTVDRRFPGG